MFEMAYSDLFLIVWASLATVLAIHYRLESAERDRMLKGAAMLTLQLTRDDKLRNKLREAFNDGAEVEFQESKDGNN